MRAFRGTHLFSTKSVEKCGKSLLGSWGAGWKMRLSAAGGPHGGSQGEGGKGKRLPGPDSSRRDKTLFDGGGGAPQGVPEASMRVGDTRNVGGSGRFRFIPGAGLLSPRDKPKASREPFSMRRRARGSGRFRIMDGLCLGRRH
jgi:hypothetical protein